MKDDNIEIEDLEEGDIVYVDKDKWFCTVVGIHYTLDNKITVEFEPCRLSIGGNFIRQYTKRKTFEEFQ